MGRKSNEYIDLLAQNPTFVVFTKGNRIQLVHKPTKKQIRSRGKGEWTISLVNDDAIEVQKYLTAKITDMENKND